MALSGVNMGPAGDNNSPPYPYANIPRESPAISIADILLTLRRDWYLPLLGLLLGLTAGAAYFFFVPELYKSTAEILIDRSVNRFFQTSKILEEPFFDDTETGSQIYVLSSESIILPIVRSMDLAHDPEFVGDGHDRGKQRPWSIGNPVEGLRQSIGWEGEPAIEPEAALERIAVERFLKRLTVDRKDVAGVITVTFASEDAKKAALIANAIVDSYIASTAEAKSKSTKMASDLVQGRLIELKQSVDAANKAVQEYRAANNLINKGAGVTPGEQMSHLTVRLAETRMQLAEAKARVDNIQQQTSKEEASGTYPENQVIQGLRSKYLELSTQATELASRVGANHAAVVKLRKEMDQVRSVIRDEEKRLSGFYVAAYQAARTQSDELDAMIAQISEEAKKESQPQATLRQLESMADSLRDSYNSVQEKFNTLNVQPSTPIQDAHIITRASPQLLKSSKKSLAVLAGGIVIGLLFGAGGAVAKEVAAGVFRTPEQVKQATGIYCVSLPVVKGSGKHFTWLRASASAVPSVFARSLAYITGLGRKLVAGLFRKSERINRLAGVDYVSAPSVAAERAQTASPKASTNSMRLAELVLDAPHSRFAESFRNIKALADASKREHGDKVIGVVSAVSKNGKSTTVSNLATLMAVSARTLVIDGDLHRRQLTSMLEPDAREGLIEALADPARLASLVRTRPRSGLDFLPCFLSKRIPNAAELLGSYQMEQLLAAARDSYDYIIVECPPIMSVVDVKMMERFLDKFVFVIEWGQTKRRVVEESLDEIDITRERILCCVLNKVEPRALRSIEAYKGPHYMEYYEA